MDNKKHLIAAVVMSAILFGGVGYVVGKKSSSQGNQAFQRGAFGERSGAPGAGGINRTFTRQNGGGTMGEVLSKDETSMTVKLQSGGSKIVFFGASTGIMRTATGSAEDITVGTQVFVSGTQNPDGSVTAESIQLRPLGMMRGSTVPQ